MDAETFTAFVVSCAVSFPIVWYAFEWFERSRSPPRRRNLAGLPAAGLPSPRSTSVALETTPPPTAQPSEPVKSKPRFVPQRRPLNSWVVMDLETTGVGSAAEIIEIAIVDAEGAVLFDQLVMPKGRIPKVVTSKTGIDRKLLRGCPRWPEIEGTVRALLSDRAVITYNAQFDIRILQQTARKWAVPPIDVDGFCAMLAYAEYRGVKHPWRKGEFKWHKQADALRHEGIAHFRLHRALPDATATRDLVLKIWEGRQARGARRMLRSFPAPMATT